MAKQLDLFGFERIELNEDEKKYTKKVNSPIYTPCVGGVVNIHACVNEQKYLRLLHRISNSTITEDEKNFLKLAASRFIEFNYESIADYYSVASNEMQELMERLALVIIDFDHAIEYGFIQLNEKTRRIYEQELNDSANG